uniref:Uncharacterized LOC105923896 n=1 Tax=Fundulus heteroclitus TaxID=8078 RepID=A0A3Q2P352_FUNHE
MMEGILEIKIEQESHEIKIEEYHAIKIEEYHAIKIEEENHEMRTEVKQENHDMQIGEENHEMEAEVKQENEEVKLEEHQEDYQDQEPDHHNLYPRNRTNSAASSGPSDLQVEKIAHKRKAPTLRNKVTDKVLDKRLTYNPTGLSTSTTRSQEAEATDLQINDTTTRTGAAPAPLGISSVSAEVHGEESRRTSKRRLTPTAFPNVFCYTKEKRKRASPTNRSLVLQQPHMEHEDLQPTGGPLTTPSKGTAHGRTGGKTFSCVKCGETFKTQMYLKKHKQIHTGDRPFSCDWWGARFNTKTHLKDHIRIHTGERPFSCDQCGATFKTTTHLREHKRSRTKERQYRCDQCGVSFKFKGILNAFWC